MRQVTFETFLKQYLADVSGQLTLNVHKLVKLSKRNHRIVSSLVLYCLFTNKMDILLKYIDTKKYPYLDELTVDNFLDDKYNKDYSFQNVHRSFTRRLLFYENENVTKSLVRDNIVKIMKEKGITNYRIYTDLKANPGNVNDFIKNNNTKKVSLKLVKDIYSYCLTK